jgi:hypothetical protein
MTVFLESTETEPVDCEGRALGSLLALNVTRSGSLFAAEIARGLWQRWSANGLLRASACNLRGESSAIFAAVRKGHLPPFENGLAAIAVRKRTGGFGRWDLI